jgi:glycosyltransferase involved in cell wall biosynthesis
VSSPPLDPDSESFRRELDHAGLVLTEPNVQLKGIYLVNGARLAAYERIADAVRRRYVAVLTHWWEVDRRRLREYQAHASSFDAVASPSPEWDRALSFAPVVRSNSSDLWVDDTMWPDLSLERDFDVVESVSVPWEHKRPLTWVREVQAYLEERGGGRAVYMTKREPNEKEDARCHQQYERFRELVEDDSRIELMVRSSQETVLQTYNRAKFLYHPATSDFGPRCITEALYCGCMVVLGRFDWVSTATAHPKIWQRIVVQDSLRPIPNYKPADVRRWHSALAAREGLMDELERWHPVNRAFERFTMFSSKRLTSSPARDA